jgi:hypothetical protein
LRSVELRGAAKIDGKRQAVVSANKSPLSEEQELSITHARPDALFGLTFTVRMCSRVDGVPLSILPLIFRTRAFKLEKFNYFYNVFLNQL